MKPSAIDTVRDKGCEFCPEHLTNHHKGNIEQHGPWIVTDNDHPLKPTRHHRLIIHREHITHVDQVAPHSWHVLMETLLKEVAKHKIAGGTLIMSFGDTKFTTAPISHLHAHIVQSDPDDPSYEKSKGLTTRIG